MSHKGPGETANQALDGGCTMVRMTIARSELIDREKGGYHHVVMRCVRRAWLCGKDPLTGRDHSHRKAWVERRMLELAEVFAVRIHAYAVMSNHYHMEVEYSPREVDALTGEEVARRWLRAYPPRRAANLELAVSALVEDPERIEVLRSRLGDLSWYMRCLNWQIARRANREDGCTGKFWEGRYYSSRPLASLEAVEACMAYVDMNPRRAGAVRDAAGPGARTSLRRRVEEASRDGEKMGLPLSPMAITEEGRVCTKGRAGVPWTLRGYLAQVDWLAARDDAGGAEAGASGAGLPAGMSDDFLATLAGFDRRWGRKEGVGDTALPGHRRRELA